MVGTSRLRSGQLAERAVNRPDGNAIGFRHTPNDFDAAGVARLAAATAAAADRPGPLLGSLAMFGHRPDHRADRHGDRGSLPTPIRRHVTDHQVRVVHQGPGGDDIALLERRRPSPLRPRLRASASPAAVRSRISDRSNWAMAQPNTWKMRTPPGVVVSMDSVGDTEASATLLEILRRRDELLERPSQSVQFPDDEVSPSRSTSSSTRHRNFGRSSRAGGAGEDLPATGLGQRLELELGVLINRADPGVANPHPHPLSKPCGASHYERRQSNGLRGETASGGRISAALGAILKTNVLEHAPVGAQQSRSLRWRAQPDHGEPRGLM